MFTASETGSPRSGVRTAGCGPFHVADFSLCPHKEEGAGASLRPLYFPFFLPVLLRYNRHTALFKFKVCSIRIDLHTSGSDHHNKFSEHPSSHIVTNKEIEK